jgi:hypothetical protein
VGRVVLHFSGTGRPLGVVELGPEFLVTHEGGNIFARRITPADAARVLGLLDLPSDAAEAKAR